MFNDVIEHIPAIHETLDACHQILKQGDFLLINLPSSQGFFYRMSKLLHALGVTSTFERVWRKDFPSPHVHYFDPENLCTLLLRAHSFVGIKTGFLPALEVTGLWQRVSYARNSSMLSRCVQFVLVLAVLPVLRLMPKDICYAIFRRE